MTILPPVPLASIAPVDDWQVDPVRRTRLLASPLLFEVLIHSVAEPVVLDARYVPYPVIDGRIRIHEARRRGLATVPARLVVPGQLNESPPPAPELRAPARKRKPAAKKAAAKKGAKKGAKKSVAKKTAANRRRRTP